MVGMSEDDAVQAITDAGFTSRVVERDGEKFAVTMDLNPERINLTVSDTRSPGHRRLTCRSARNAAAGAGASGHRHRPGSWWVERSAQAPVRRSIASCTREIRACLVAARERASV